MDFSPPNVRHRALLSPAVGHQPPCSSKPHTIRSRRRPRGGPPPARLGQRTPSSLVCVYTCLCTLARTQGRRNKLVFQKCLPTPGWGIKTPACDWERVWVVHREREPFKSNFPWSPCRDKHSPSSGCRVWGAEQTEKASDRQFYRCEYPSVSSSCLW